jgi:hypothetical protein
MSVSVPQSLRVWVPDIFVRYRLLKIRLEYQHHSRQKKNRIYIFVISSNTYSREIYCAFSIRSGKPPSPSISATESSSAQGIHTIPRRSGMTLQEVGLIGCFASEVEIVQPLKCMSVSVCTSGWEVVITNGSNALDRSNNMLAI